MKGSRHTKGKAARMRMIGACGVVLGAVLLFFSLFYVKNIEVIGNIRYTEEQIISYMDSPLMSNSLLAMLFKSQLEKKKPVFVESLELEWLDRQTLRIHVNEKQSIGYIVQDDQMYYFDSEGLVLDAIQMTADEIEARQAEEEQFAAQKAAASEDAQDLAGDGTDTSGDGADDGTAEDGTDTSEDETDASGEGASEDETDASAEPEILQAEDVVDNDDATAFHAAVTDVPEIVGISTGTLVERQTVPTEDDTIFYTILSITRMVGKLDILPEIVFFDQEENITLVYNEGTIHCLLGKDELLEEKITRVAAILPNLDGKTGILHLEDYASDTVNIIFSEETLYDLKLDLYEAKEGAGEDEEQ